MSNFISQILTYLYLFLIGITSIFFFLVALLIKAFTFPFDKKLIVLNLFTSFWSSCYLWCVPTWNIKKIGRENFSIKKNYIVVSNHQSQMDIFLAFYLFLPFRWISKREVFNIPFIGWNMLLNKYVGIKRGDKESVKKMMKQCESILASGCSLFFFPEGTRSDTGKVKPFKPGAFILAKKMKVNILPIIIQGTRDILPKNSARLTWRGKMNISVLDEISYKDFDDKSPEQSAEMVHDLFVKILGEN